MLVQYGTYECILQYGKIPYFFLGTGYHLRENEIKNEQPNMQINGMELYVQLKQK